VNYFQNLRNFSIGYFLVPGIVEIFSLNNFVFPASRGLAQKVITIKEMKWADPVTTLQKFTDNVFMI
jgi:hypothetical protein